MTKRLTIAIDGPAAAGKGTIAKALSDRFALPHLDTGLLYRAVGQSALALGQGVILPHHAIAAAKALRPVHLSHPDLRKPAVARAASEVAAIPEVREALVRFQRTFAEAPAGAVLDGRDIGTVICPGADLKLFVTASQTARATRRHAELTGRGQVIDYQTVLNDLAKRDQRDAARATAPMTVADDAVLIDTTELDIDAAVAQAAELVEQKLRD